VADGVAITAGAGTTILTDDCGAPGHAQGMKIAYSADGVATFTTVDANGILVSPGASVKRIEVDSAGLTTASTAYTAGDQVGTEYTFANAARISGGGGVIAGITVLDKPKVMSGTPASFDFYLFHTSVTGAADNAAFDDSDSDMGNCLAIINFTTGAWISSSSNAVAPQHGLSIPYTCATTSLFGIMVCRTNHTFFGATSDLRVGLNLIRD
jgi:hypothetical protein